MANTGQPNSNDTQFFITNATQPAANSSLMFNYTIFGQVVSGLNLVNEMTQVALTADPVSRCANRFRSVRSSSTRKRSRPRTPTA